jgi:hypothetical protein
MILLSVVWWWRCSQNSSRIEETRRAAGCIMSCALHLHQIWRNIMWWWSRCLQSQSLTVSTLEPSCCNEVSVGVWLLDQGIGSIVDWTFFSTVNVGLSQQVVQGASVFLFCSSFIAFISLYERVLQVLVHQRRLEWHRQWKTRDHEEREAWMNESLDNNTSSSCFVHVLYFFVLFLVF